MDQQNATLVSFTPTSIPRPTFLQTLTKLSAKNIPSPSELRAIESQLLEYKTLHEQRLKHCDDQVAILDAQYNNAREKKHDKLGKIDRSERSSPQPSYTKGSSIVARPSGSTAVVPSSQPSIPAISVTPKTAPRASSAALRTDSSLSKQKNKKRKREPDSDDFMIDGSTRNGTPSVVLPPKAHPTKEQHKSKKAKHDDNDIRVNAGGFRKVSDWSDSLKGGLPPRPPRNPLPIPQIYDPNLINDDMSDRKQPSNQVLGTTYWNYLEPWLRQLREEDVAFLSFDGEDEELFEMPPLGKHYTEVWADEDRVAAALKGPNGAYPPIKPTVSRNNNPYAAFTDTVPPSAGGSLLASNAGARWDPATLTEQDAITEEHGSGPLTERIFSSFLLIPGAVNQEDEDTSRGFGLGRASGQGTVGDLEERLMRECKALGLFQESGEPDYTQAQDDQIASELRRCQRALRAQMKVNEARKRRLAEVATARLAYAEYEDYKEAMEKHLADSFARLGNADAPKANKKKKKDKDKSSAVTVVDYPNGSAGVLGLGLVGLDGNLQVPKDLTRTVEILKRYEKNVGGGFEKLEQEHPGLILGLPKSSIYQGLEKDIAELEKKEAAKLASKSSKTATDAGPSTIPAKQPLSGVVSLAKDESPGMELDS